MIRSRRQTLTRTFIALTAALACTAAAAAARHRDMVLIPAGDFYMGTDKVDNSGRGKEFGTAKPLYLDEHPRHKVHTASYWIDRYEVTNAQYRRFVIGANYQVPRNWEENGYLLTQRVLDGADIGKLRQAAANVFKLDMDTRTMDRAALLKAIDKAQHEWDKLPVTTVSWYSAQDYCRWVGKRLPTEAEWERAARGPHDFEFPWGNSWVAADVNAGDDPRWEHGVSPVGSYPGGKSPYGLFDMAGNVMEWVADWYLPYPGSDYHSEDFGRKYKVLRGGGWGGIGHYAIHHFYRGAYRFFTAPTAAFNDVGFRCAADAVAPGGAGSAAQERAAR